MRGHHAVTAPLPGAAARVDGPVGRLAPAWSGSPSPLALAAPAERPLHGYELLELLPPLVGAQRVDVGNLYRLPRPEEDGVVTSRVSADLPGRRRSAPTR